MAKTKSSPAPAPKKAAKAAKKQTGVARPSSEAAADLQELLEDELKDIYWAEKALTKALPKMAKNATTEELVTCINDHLAQTQGHVQRLEQAFELLGKPARAKKCEAMDGLLKEAQDILQSTEPGPVRDAGIILASQKVEHYEIATYGTLAAFAKLLKKDDVAALLVETLNEEKAADAKLTDIAENSINLEAEEAEGDEEEEDEE